MPSNPMILIDVLFVLSFVIVRELMIRINYIYIYI